MSKSDYRRRRLRRFKRTLSRHLPTFIALVCIVLVSGGLIFSIYRFVLHPKASSAGLPPASGSIVQTAEAASKSTAAGHTAEREASASQIPLDETGRLIAQADRIALGYDYDRATALLADSGLDTSDGRIPDAIARYEEAKAALVPVDVTQTTHVFFNSLIMDTSLAFDGDADAAGYNSVMTTREEFLKILEALYARDYVLVRLHDIAAPAADSEGNVSFAWGTILLPPGKKPLVMSQDDVCYYPYMDGDGFASRIVIGEDGKPTCEMTLADGTVSTGSYDLIPILEDFIQEHPDFSYKGAPAVAQCLRDNGWELASHSWGHLQLGVSADSETGFVISDDRFVADTDKWEAEVESLIGPTDILIYPYGNDISDWHSYGQDNARFAYLQSKGFQYFCNVDASTPYWMQKGSTYLRMARRNLDGYRLYQDLVETDPAKKRLTDLFDAADIFDTARPTPVEWSY